MKRIQTCVVALFVLFCFVLVFAMGSSRSGTTHTRVPPSPRVEIHELKDQNKVPGYALTAYIKADAKTVFDIVADTGNVDKIFPDVQSKLVKKEPGGDKSVTKIVWNYTITTPIGEKVLDVRVTENHLKYTLEWKRVSGDLKDFEGYGSVTTPKEHPGWAKLEYNHFVNAGGMTPQFMTNRSNKHDLLGMVENIEKIIDPGK